MVWFNFVLKIYGFSAALLLIAFLTSPIGLIGITSYYNGENFHQFNWIRTNGPSGGWINTVNVHPDNSDILLAGGKKGFFKSLNGGEEWIRMDEQLMYEVFVILFDPVNSNIIYVAGDARFCKSSDGGKTWKDLDMGFVITGDDIRQLIINDTNSEILYAATRYGIFKTEDSGETWANITDGLGSSDILSIGIVDSNEIFVGTSITTPNQTCLYSTVDGGINWNQVDIGLPDIRLDNGVKSILVDPYNPGVVYVGFGYDLSLQTKYMLKTTNSSLLWEAKAIPVETPGALVSAISPEDVLYITCHQCLYRSFDGGDNWDRFYERISHLGVTSDLGRGSFTIDPSNSSILYLALRGNGIIKSCDGGESWSHINNGLSNTVVNLVAVDPKNPNVVYVASTMGVSHGKKGVMALGSRPSMHYKLIF